MSAWVIVTRRRVTTINHYGSRYRFDSTTVALEYGTFSPAYRVYFRGQRFILALEPPSFFSTLNDHARI